MIGLPGKPVVLYRLPIRCLKFALKEVRRAYQRVYQRKKIKEVLFRF